VWVLEKKLFEQYSKNDREVVLEVFRRGCMQLTKLRHPRVLTVQQSLEESRFRIVIRPATAKLFYNDKSE